MPFTKMQVICQLEESHDVWTWGLDINTGGHVLCLLSI